MTLFYRSYLITFGILLGAIAGFVIYLDQTGAIALHWGFTALAAIAVVAGLILFLTGAIGKPATVDRWADSASCNAEGTAYVALLALPVYGLLWFFSGSDRTSTRPITEMRRKRAKRRRP
ncbi:MULTISPECIES: hypothetical protein [Agrobacterium]|uniref:hypothetical protein n=1 Tax=Agrobacterium TaxID=357 RepID=UPI0009B990FD|nr:MULTISPECIES: hypothetical protein [Agrobacterium]QCL77417.1 hypothetical protein CFBP5499_28605 [Agrobacterium tumefaciens]CUX72204.1 membrane hypothetical protein [Agrobacterium sp. NCPPB 925]